MDPRRTKAKSAAKKPTTKKAASKPRGSKSPADFKSLDEALKARVPADAAADHFKVDRRDAQIRRLELGLLKDGPMKEYWKGVKAHRNGKK